MCTYSALHRARRFNQNAPEISSMMPTKQDANISILLISAVSLSFNVYFTKFHQNNRIPSSCAPSAMATSRHQDYSAHRSIIIVAMVCRHKRWLIFLLFLLLMILSRPARAVEFMTASDAAVSMRMKLKAGAVSLERLIQAWWISLFDISKTVILLTAFDCKNRKNGQYSVGCSAFYWWCFAQHSSKHVCPRGTIYDKDRLQCLFKEQVSCVPELCRIHVKSEGSSMSTRLWGVGWRHFG